MLDNLSSKQLNEIKDCLDNLSSDEKNLSVKELVKLVQEKNKKSKELEEKEFAELKNTAKELVSSFQKLSKKEWKFDVDLPLTITFKIAGGLSPQEFVDCMDNQIYVLEFRTKINGTINNLAKREIQEYFDDLTIECFERLVGKSKMKQSYDEISEVRKLIPENEELFIKALDEIC